MFGGGPWRPAPARRFQMSLAVWADSVDVALQVCTDARLRGGTVQPADPDGETYGQGGWDVGIHFANLTDLASQLTMLTTQTLPPHMCAPSAALWSWSSCQSSCPAAGPVTRLAINAHGLSGKLYIGGRPDPTVARDVAKEKLALSKDNIPIMAADLKRIYQATAPHSTILLMGCVAGSYDAGTE